MLAPARNRAAQDFRTTSMVSQERKDRRKRAVREEIIDAARDIMLREGYSALSMRRIAEAIGYAPSTLYLYFRDREEIANELSLLGYKAFRDYLEPSTGDADPWARLCALAKAYQRFASEYPETYRLIFMGEPKFVQAISSKRVEPTSADGQWVLEQVGAAFVQLKSSARLNTERPPHLLAETMWLSLHGIVSMKIFYPDFPMSAPDALLDALLEGFRHGILKPATHGAR